MRAATRFEGQSDFAIFLRTGTRFRHQAGGDVEAKFNPWHDPDDGRFTFAGQGRNFPLGVTSSDDRNMSRRPPSPPTSGATRTIDIRPILGDVEAVERHSALDPRLPRNHSIYRARRGDSLTRIAQQRQGLHVSDLAWINGLSPDSRLNVGQPIKLPNQGLLDRHRDNFGVVRGLAAYMDRHGGRIPPGLAPLGDQLAADRPPALVLNGYRFQQDGLIRTRLSEGDLGHGRSRPSRVHQRRAGGADRRPTDDGGHYVARRFNGPSDPANLFAQDKSFNRGAYRVLENEIAAEQRRGKSVYIRIIPRYRGISQRPHQLDYWWRVDGKWHHNRSSTRREGAQMIEPDYERLGPLLAEYGQAIADEVGHLPERAYAFVCAGDGWVQDKVYVDEREAVRVYFPDSAEIIRDIYEAENAKRKPALRWVYFNYDIEDGKFRVRFFYPEEIPARTTHYDWQDSALNDRFGNKRVIEPDIPVWDGSVDR